MIGRVSTYVQPVVVSAESVHDSLLGRCLISHNPVWLAILRDFLSRGRARDTLREFLAISFCAEIERGALMRRNKVNELRISHDSTQLT